MNSEVMSESDPHHFFTAEEVNALIPQMEEHFQNFWRARKKAQLILEELRKQAKNSETDLPDEIAEKQVKQSQVYFLLEQGKKELERVQELGGIIKDFEIGLVDFPHMLEFEEEKVLICWKYGEKKVRYYHGLNEGFSNRKPLPRRVHH